MMRERGRSTKLQEGFKEEKKRSQQIKGHLLIPFFPEPLTNNA
jgi:hypothetical protein